GWPLTRRRARANARRLRATDNRPWVGLPPGTARPRPAALPALARLVAPPGGESTMRARHCPPGRAPNQHPVRRRLLRPHRLLPTPCPTAPACGGGPRARRRRSEPAVV